MIGRRTIARFSMHGLTLRVFYRKGNTPLQLEIEDRRLGLKRRPQRRSFRHDDAERAVSYASELFRELSRTLPEARGPYDELTIGDAVRRYVASAAFAQAGDRTKKDRYSVLDFMLNFSDWSRRRADCFDQEDVLRYFQARTTGAFVTRRFARAVSARRAQAELQMLRTALQWAYRTKVKGKRIVGERVFDSIVMPAAPDPCPPTIVEGEFKSLWSVRDRVNPAFGAALALAYVYGKRSGAIRQLRWEDIDGESRRICWKPEFDKEKRGVVCTIPDDVFAVIDLWKANPQRADSPWMFYASRAVDRPIGRSPFFAWLKRAYVFAGLDRPSGAGWHCLRRSFVTRNAHTDSKAAMYIAGMSCPDTFFRYQRPEADALARVLDNRLTLANL